LGAGLTVHVCKAYRVFSLSRYNSELIASVARIVEGDVHFPAPLVLVLLVFALLSQRVARCPLSE
jgi:hypothetical protein